VSDPTPEIPNLKILRKIGDGGMSTVWKAWDEVRNRIVAVKVLRQEFTSDGDEVRQFRTEEKLMEEIHHPGVVEAYDFNRVGDTCYFVMEYVDGYSFSDHLRRKQHLKESDCLLICESIASALDFAWNEHGVVHCDIKPENIMINTGGVIKILDLGISHRFQYIEGPIDVPDRVLGTPAYISPEQVYGDIELDCRSDIYSLAASVYHLATGRILFPGLGNDDMMRAHCDATTQARDPRTYRPELSEGFCQLLESMLVKDRDWRVSDWKSVFNLCQDVERGSRFKRRSNAAVSSVRLLA